jgi:hypothetical protein
MTIAKVILNSYSANIRHLKPGQLGQLADGKIVLGVEGLPFAVGRDRIDCTEKRQPYAVVLETGELLGTRIDVTVLPEMTIISVTVPKPLVAE